MRGDGFVAILAGMADDADTALLGEPTQSVQPVIRACDLYADRVRVLQAAVERPVELGDDLVGASECLLSRLEEALGQIAHGRLPHVKHRASDHPAHAA